MKTIQTNLMNRYVLAALSLAALSLAAASCAHNVDLQQLTALNVDCETKKIQISDDSIALNGEESWTAKCNGKTYSCDYLYESDMGCYELNH